MLPKHLSRAKAPPIKCQGIKTKLVPFILSSIQWNGQGRWVEPFLGSGVVAFNLVPPRALLADSNEHVIRLYKDVQSGTITPKTVRAHLEREGQILQRRGEKHYYEIRDRFNKTAQPLDFLFLNRSCFNGLMRFNQSGEFNVPFCRKPKRFRAAYVTRITNQVDWLRKRLLGKDWVFTCSDWKETLDAVEAEDFVYLDPPYIGRHAGYYNGWSEDDAMQLAEKVKTLPCGFGYSMWKANRHRENDHLPRFFSEYPILTQDHFYHVGATEKLRNAMEEALVLSSAHVADAEERTLRMEPSQAEFSLG